MTLDRRAIRYRRGLRSYPYLELAATACRRLRLPYTRRCRRWRRPDREGVASRSRLALSPPPRHRAEWQLLQVTSRAPRLDTSEEYGMRHHATVAPRRHPCGQAARPDRRYGRRHQLTPSTSDRLRKPM